MNLDTWFDFSIYSIWCDHLLVWLSKSYAVYYVEYLYSNSISKNIWKIIKNLYLFRYDESLSNRAKKASRACLFIFSVLTDCFASSVPHSPLSPIKRYFFFTSLLCAAVPHQTVLPRGYIPNKQIPTYWCRIRCRQMIFIICGYYKKMVSVGMLHFTSILSSEEMFFYLLRRILRDGKYALAY